MESLPLFIVASLALIITPGPDLIYVLTRGIADGKWPGAVSAIGVTCGLLVHTVAAALGLAVLLKTSVIAFWALKIAGGVYLIYLGFQMIRSPGAIVTDEPRNHFDIRKCFFQGFLSDVLNPKIALFFVAFLPQFVRPDVADRFLYLIGLGLLYALMTIAFLVVLGVFAGTIGSWLKARKGVERGIRIGSGSVLMLLGLRLLIPQRN